MTPAAAAAGAGGRPSEPTAAAVAALPEILTREQAAWLLRLSPGRLDAAVKRGEIPARKVGRKWLYSKTALLSVITGGAAARSED